MQDPGEMSVDRRDGQADHVDDLRDSDALSAGDPIDDGPLATIGDPLHGDATPAPTLVVVLAAGAGSRFSGETHKLEAVLGDRTVAEHSIIAAIASGVGNVVVVTGASQPSAQIMSALASAQVDDSSDSGTVQFLHHADWADGQASSLRVALAEATRAGVGAVVVGLADQPGVVPEAWRRVAASRSPIAVASYDGLRGHPVRLHHSVWDLLPTDGDQGARSVMRLHPELVEQIPCPGSAHDIDTREDLQLWQSKSSTSSP